MENDANAQIPPDDEKAETTATSPVPDRPGQEHTLSRSYITLGIMAANVVVYLLMVLNGVHFMQPTSEALVAWGADYGPLTLRGDWWRMLSCCFVHIGLVHLLFNMYAFVQVGYALEAILGRFRLVAVYLLCGITSSTLSLYVHPETVSAGASGAIFGLYGFFLALLFAKFIHESVRNELLQSVLLFVGYNLFLGLRGGVDNAAHIGGLLGGLAIGYIILPSLRRPFDLKSYMRTLVISALAVLLVALPLAYRKTFDSLAFDREIQVFSEKEHEALQTLQVLETESDPATKVATLRKGLEQWDEIISNLEAQDTTQMPERVLNLTRNLKRYSALRKKSYGLLIQSIQKGDTGVEDPEFEQCLKEIEEVLEVLNAE
ncbi:MAG: rhomboid family intramembrane serine protease [Saprospiraceae bacterium]|nr:rhomboid family intramembrane serine protease [Saprospiraceae bacterium]